MIGFGKAGAAFAAGWPVGAHVLDRGAAEMENRVTALEALCTGNAMCRNSIARQRAIGVLTMMPSTGPDAKIAAISKRLST